MGLQFTITPQFKTKEIVDNTIGKYWFEFQASAFDLGARTQQYMIDYIKGHKHRIGSSGLLERSIDLVTQTGAGFVSWGIGTVTGLPNYYYVLNYGKKITGEDFIPGGGKIRPVEFSDGNADSSKRGVGTGQVWTYKRITGTNEPIPSVVRPMNYIEATRFRLNANLRNLINKLKRNV